MQISRSGRVIKPKKFLYDEEGKEEVDQTKQKPKAAETPEPTKETPSKEESTPKRVSKEKPKKAKGNSFSCFFKNFVLITCHLSCSC